MYFRQARNGMWIRAALLAHIFNADHQISRFFHEQFSQWGETPERRSVERPATALAPQRETVMALLIDGYNLLHVTGLVGRAGSGLQGSRNALLRFLAAAIDPSELKETTIVFDATEAPPGLPRVVTHEGMTVRYASDYPDADALLEELIAAHHVPRSLTVVSSDHRVQRAARRRRAPFVDSDVWFTEVARRRGRGQPTANQGGDRELSLTADEIAYWIDKFGDTAVDADGSKRGVRSDFSDEAPFPPGYGDDLLDD